MALCLTAVQAANLRYRGLFGQAKLEPVLLSDGRYAVSAGVLSDRRFAQQRHLLAAGSIESDGELTFENDTSLRLTVNSQPMRLSAAQNAHTFGIPASGVYRFECRRDDFGWGGDKANNNRRSELISDGDTYASAETLWAAFSFVVGPDHDPFDAGVPNEHNMIHQWHSVDDVTPRAPVLAIELLSGMLEVNTRSDTTGATKQVRYSAARPTDGVVHHVVVAGLLGSAGHLDVWLDGSQIVDVDCPIGYYNDDAGARDLAYPHWGIYQKNVDAAVIVFHANMEWGLTDLSGRVATPLSVTAPAQGWV